VLPEFFEGQALILSRIVGGHHGIFPRASDLLMGQDTLGNQRWCEARNSIVAAFAQTIGIQKNDLGADIKDPFLVPVLGGLVSVVDWIGSNQAFFPCNSVCGRPLETKIDDYWDNAQEQAHKALEELGWLPAPSFASPACFEHIFTCKPNGVQRAVTEVVDQLDSPYLIIVEATMGQGKTEAALYAADLAMCRGFARGIYVALPTQATSNAMYDRVRNDYLAKRGHKGNLNLQLVHGNALLADLNQAIDDVASGQAKVFEVDAVEDDTGGSIDKKANLEAQSWFTAKKRPLLAPLGVGTIDQALLSVLQTKHWFVRMFGLAGKVVIFDEVHAYDAYMSTILERLLHWLAELDCTVILLSATLPDAGRKALARAYSGRDDAEYRRYPRVTLAKPRHFLDTTEQDQPKCFEVKMEQGREVRLSFEKTELENLSKTLSEKMANGGCAAVICNTVDRSIEVFQHLRDNLKDTECLLFHARTLQRWRREREEQVRKKFGKNGDRPKRVVLVATQVVEQSLDLDFDLMVSEIAPIDLLLQRLGRMHRHSRQRPNGLETPEFIVLCDAERSGEPPDTFGKSIEYVYDRFILLRTWLALRGRHCIEIPKEIEELIEFVYGSEGAVAGGGWPEALDEAKKKMDFEHSESEKKACRLLVSRPKAPADLIEDFNDQLADDEDPTVHKDVRAATREGDSSITVVMLPEGETLTTNPKIPEVKKLLDRAAKISHRGLFQAFLEKGNQPKEWKDSTHLRYARLMCLDSDSHGTIDGYSLDVDESLGVVITKGEPE
jgi:CRISPR-associated endonuclease/helicase Cas3